jgi:hypothetical protein
MSFKGHVLKAWVRAWHYWEVVETSRAAGASRRKLGHWGTFPGLFPFLSLLSLL